MGVGPNLPTTKKGKNIIMSQGQTDPGTTAYGLDPYFEGVAGVADEPKPIKP